MTVRGLQSGTLKQLHEVLAEFVSGDTDPAAPLSVAGLDSLGQIEFCVAVERHFDVVVPDAMIPALSSLHDYAALLETWTSGHRLADSGPSPQFGIGNHVRLRPVRHGDLEVLYETATAPGGTGVVRWHNSNMSRETFERLLWRGVLCQFMVELLEPPHHPVGCVTAYDYAANGSVYAAVFAMPASVGTGVALEGFGLLVSYLFQHFDLRSVIIEAAESHLRVYASARRHILQHCGRLKAHRFVAGAYEDVHLFRITREQWSALEGRWWTALTAPVGAPSA